MDKKSYQQYVRVLHHNRLESRRTDDKFTAVHDRATNAISEIDALLRTLGVVAETELPIPTDPRQLPAAPSAEPTPFSELVAQTHELKEVQTAYIIDNDDLTDIVLRYERTVREVSEDHQPSYWAGVLAGLISGVIDIVLVGGNSAEIGRKVLSLMGASETHEPKATKVSFDYVPREPANARGNHRSNSVSHHVSLGGLIAGIRDVLSGTSTHVIDGEVHTWINVTKGVALQLRKLGTGGGAIEVVQRVLAALRVVLQHWWSDINTSLGLPGPFMLLAKFMEFGSFEFGGKEGLTVADLAHKLFDSGLDFRRFIGDGITVVVNEVLVRLFMLLESIWLGQDLRSAIGLLKKRADSIRMTLVLAHGMTAAIDAGKVYVTSNPLLINIPQWAAFGRSLLGVLLRECSNSIGSIESAHTQAWGELMRSELIQLCAIDTSSRSMPILRIG